MFYDSRTNAALYPAWQERFRTTNQKPIIFGAEKDFVFSSEDGDATSGV